MTKGMENENFKLLSVKVKSLKMYDIISVYKGMSLRSVSFYMDNVKFIEWHDGGIEIYLYKFNVKGSNDGLDVNKEVENG
jgi:hypothetical protein